MKALSHNSGDLEIILDGAIDRVALSKHSLACCVGARILVFNSYSSWERKCSFPLPVCESLLKLRLTDIHIFALSHERVLFYRTLNPDADWEPLSVGIEKIYDFEVDDKRLFLLARGFVGMYKYVKMGDLNEELILDVPVQARQLKYVPPYLAVYGPFALLIVRIVENELKLVYLDNNSYPNPTAVAYQNEEILIADHLEGLSLLRKNENNRFTLSKKDSNIVHPYTVAWDGNTWSVACEHGVFQWKAGQIIPFDLGTEPIHELQNFNERLLAVQSQRIKIKENRNIQLLLDCPGYNFDVSDNRDLIACVAQSGLYIIEKRSKNFKRHYIPLLPSSSTYAVSLSSKFAYVASNEELLSFDISRLPNIKLLGTFRGEGEPVSLFIDPNETHAYWAYGRFLRVIKLGANGMFEMAKEIAIGTYVHSMSIGKDRLYIACGPGGLVWGEISHLSELYQVPNVSYATDVSTFGQYIALTTGRQLLIFYHSSGKPPTLVYQLDDQQDLCACFLIGQMVYFSAGKKLSRAIFDLKSSFEIIETFGLPFPPRRLRLTTEGRLIATGIGGTVMVNFDQIQYNINWKYNNEAPTE